MHLVAPRTIVPEWPAPPRVRALATTRQGGVSRGPYASLNLGDHVGDDPAHVARNRALLGRELPRAPLWLAQEHGVAVVEAETARGVPVADAAVAHAPGFVLAALTADCLPVLLASRDGDAVGIAHAGWRGLAAGVVEATVAKMRCEPGALVAWLGPAIGPAWFEVGDEVRDAFTADDRSAAAAFAPGRPGKWHADLYALARRRLARAGVSEVHGGRWCTFTDHERFFSYRRDGRTGRMATLVWLEG
ncbi:MAG: peptidoglycan editing factor PgeF [Burkholderiales bacterium]|nr:peptidoglycan editing factor PgeF [Burkholderiales bacterium]